MLKARHQYCTPLYCSICPSDEDIRLLLAPKMCVINRRWSFISSCPCRAIEPLSIMFYHAHRQDMLERFLYTSSAVNKIAPYLTTTYSYHFNIYRIVIEVWLVLINHAFICQWNVEVSQNMLCLLCTSVERLWCLASRFSLLHGKQTLNSRWLVQSNSSREVELTDRLVKGRVKSREMVS